MGLLYSSRRALLGYGGSYRDKVMGYDPVAYWRLSETVGTVAVCQVNPLQNGTYSSDVSLWPPGSGIGDGNTAPLFDGANDFVDVFSATFAAAFDGDTGTVMIWARVFNAGVWADGAQRMNLIFDQVAFTDVIQLRKLAGANSYNFNYTAGGVSENVSPAMSPAAWTHYAMTWDKPSDEMKAYLDGTQTGATQGTLGVWGAAIARALIGSANWGNLWYGWQAHCAVWDSVLTQPQLADLATV